MPPKKPDYSKDYTQWKSIHIEVPSEFITHTKSGRISIRRPLTKTQGLSRSNKEPSIMITERLIASGVVVVSGKVLASVIKKILERIK